MALFTAAGYTVKGIADTAAARLSELRRSLEDCQDLFRWISGCSLEDLMTLGFSEPDATTLQSALSDANAVAEIYMKGLPPPTYPQPPQAYAYSASQARVIGPS